MPASPTRCFLRVESHAASPLEHMMISKVRFWTALSLLAMSGTAQVFASGSFICQEPGGKRLIQIDGNDISKPGGKILIYINGNDLLVGDVHAKATLVVDDDDVRPSPSGVKIA